MIVQRIWTCPLTGQYRERKIKDSGEWIEITYPGSKIDRFSLYRK